MGSFFPRKLLSDPINQTVYDSICYNCDDSNETERCLPPCFKVCPEICKHRDDYSFQSPPLVLHHYDKTKRISIISLSVLASIFLIACLLTIYIKSRWRSRSRSREQDSVDAHDEFLDEDHGPFVDHPIWYIRTVGLHPSVIGSISVCRYSKGDGLVDGTDCSVCLSEFEEDETLKLLPKCNHAFHVICIDTWLRSHTSCPLCRAPIVTNTNPSSSSQVNFQIPDNTRMGIQDQNQESERETEEDIQETEEQFSEIDTSTNVDTEVDEIQRVRRSVSMDSSSAYKISQAVLREGYNENCSNFVPIRRKDPNWKILILAGSSSIVGRSIQNGPAFLKRSVSCGAKFLFSR